jgi:hypothetical protein
MPSSIIENSSFQQISVKRLCTPNGNNGLLGQFLRSNGNGIEWGNGSGGSGLFVEQLQSNDDQLNNYVLNGPAIFLKNAGSDVILTGISTTSADGGNMVFIYNSQSTPLHIKHLDSSSLAQNRIFCASTNGQFLGEDGMAQCVYDSTSQLWRCSLLSFGKPISIPFNAADYTIQGTGAGMSVSINAGNVKFFRFIQIGTQLTITHNATGWGIVTPGGGDIASRVAVKIPFGFETAPWIESASECRFVIFIKDLNVAEYGTCTVGYDVTNLIFRRADDDPWTNSSSNCELNYSITFDVD